MNCQRPCSIVNCRRAARPGMPPRSHESPKHRFERWQFIGHLAEQFLATGSVEFLGIVDKARIELGIHVERAGLAAAVMGPDLCEDPD